MQELIHKYIKLHLTFDDQKGCLELNLGQIPIPDRYSEHVTVECSVLGHSHTHGCKTYNRTRDSNTKVALPKSKRDLNRSMEAPGGTTRMTSCPSGTLISS